VRPGDAAQVQAVLAAATRHRVAVVPFGGGTSVVGGLVARRDAPYAGVVSLDLVRMKRLLDVDPVSMTATLEPGLRGPEAEALLAEHGLTLGHFPQSFEYATIGGFAATRSSGQSSAGYGRFDSLVVGLTVATPAGPLDLGRAPASAAGPDLRQLFLGSEGAFGVITSVTVRVRRLPEEKVYEGWRWASFDAGAAAVRTLAQTQLLPTVLRLSDENETALNLADPDAVGGSSTGGCLMVVGHEGTADAVAARRAEVSAVLTELGGTAVGDGPGQAWSAGRYSAPYLRDSMLDVGVLVETLETATWWSHLREVYDAVSAALRTSLGDPSLVLCHISHVYETGASLYFTVAASEGDDPVGKWRQAKRAASDALVAAGATITHHHAIGTDHQPWLADEIGELGIGVLRAVKATVDPEGILNPGVLLP
jgi:alkyldihydroxyacetonephosphate synthase